MMDDNIKLVSLHGGHSGEFCSHAEDRLEDIVLAYIEQGFTYVGITEHIPPIADRFIYPEEKRSGLDCVAVHTRFARYITVARELQKKYSPQLKTLVGFETESWSGYRDFILQLREEFQPDYIVGSVHHVDDIPFDYSLKEYQKAVVLAGSLEKLYCRYFDLQLEMINHLQPELVGHLDLIRIYDPGYRARMQQVPEIRDRIQRNLEQVKTLDLTLDCNFRSLDRDGNPYPARFILQQARELGIKVAPGDDSHSVKTVGRGIREGILLLQKLGFHELGNNQLPLFFSSLQ